MSERRLAELERRIERAEQLARKIPLNRKPESTAMGTAYGNYAWHSAYNSVIDAGNHHTAPDPYLLFVSDLGVSAPHKYIKTVNTEDLSINDGWFNFARFDGGTGTPCTIVPLQDKIVIIHYDWESIAAIDPVTYEVLSENAITGTGPTTTDLSDWTSTAYIACELQYDNNDNITGFKQYTLTISTGEWNYDGEAIYYDLDSSQGTMYGDDNGVRLTHAEAYFDGTQFAAWFMDSEYDPASPPYSLVRCKLYKQTISSMTLTLTTGWFNWNTHYEQFRILDGEPQIDYVTDLYRRGIIIKGNIWTAATVGGQCKLAFGYGTEPTTDVATFPSDDINANGYRVWSIKQPTNTDPDTLYVYNTDIEETSVEVVDGGYWYTSGYGYFHVTVNGTYLRYYDNTLTLLFEGFIYDDLLKDKY